MRQHATQKASSSSRRLRSPPTTRTKAPSRPGSKGKVTSQRCGQVCRFFLRGMGEGERVEGEPKIQGHLAERHVITRRKRWTCGQTASLLSSLDSPGTLPPPHQPPDEMASPTLWRWGARSVRTRPDSRSSPYFCEWARISVSGQRHDVSLGVGGEGWCGRAITGGEGKREGPTRLADSRFRIAPELSTHMHGSTAASSTMASSSNTTDRPRQAELALRDPRRPTPPKGPSSTEGHRSSVWGAVSCWSFYARPGVAGREAQGAHRRRGPCQEISEGGEWG